MCCVSVTLLEHSHGDAVNISEFGRAFGTNPTQSGVSFDPLFSAFGPFVLKTTGTTKARILDTSKRLLIIGDITIILGVSRVYNHGMLLHPLQS